MTADKVPPAAIVFPIVDHDMCEKKPPTRAAKKAMAAANNVARVFTATSRQKAIMHMIETRCVRGSGAVLTR
jgi:hypothetical protein